MIEKYSNVILSPENECLPKWKENVQISSLGYSPSLLVFIFLLSAQYHYTTYNTHIHTHTQNTSAVHGYSEQTLKQRCYHKKYGTSVETIPTCALYLRTSTSDSTEFVVYFNVGKTSERK